MGYQIGAKGPEWYGGSIVLVAPQLVATPLPVVAAPQWKVAASL